MWHRQALRQDTCVLAVHIFDLIFFLQRFWSNNNNNTNNKDTARVTQADTDAKCQSIGSMYPYLSSYLFLQRFWSAHFTRTCFTDLLSWSILSLSAVKTLSPPSADKVSKLNLGSSENNLEQKIKFQIFHSKYVGLHPFVQIFYWSKFCFRSVQCDTHNQAKSFSTGQAVFRRSDATELFAAVEHLDTTIPRALSHQAINLSANIVRSAILVTQSIGQPNMMQGVINYR